MIRRHYLKTFFIGFTATMVSTAAINYVINPYGYFPEIPLPGLNTIKPSAGDRVRTSKPNQVLRFSPSILIGGNSRPEMGLNPTDQCWGNEQQPIYNISTPGASTYLQTRYIQHALESNTITHIYLGVDFMDFLKKEAAPDDYATWPTTPHKFEQPLLVNQHGAPNPDYLLARFKDSYNALFSLETLADSLITVATQHRPHTPNRDSNGFNPAREYIDIIHAEGQHVLFAQKNREVLKKFYQPENTIFQSDTQWSTSYESLKRLLNSATSKAVGVTLFINPYHAEYLSSIAITHQWQNFENWKRKLTQMSQQYGVTIWDFSLINPMSSESIGTLNGNKQRSLTWFWEPAHYKQELGKRMIAQMTGEQCLDEIPHKFGHQLVSQDIEQHLALQRSLLDDYMADNTSIINRLCNVLNSLQSHNQRCPETKLTQ